jgi:N-acetylglutamate synthase
MAAEPVGPGSRNTRERVRGTPPSIGERQVGSVFGGVGVSASRDFSPDDLGHLVMVRRRLDDEAAATAGDVVGELEAITAEGLTIRRRDDSLVEVPRPSVLAAKRVGVSALAARSLEGVAARGWAGLDSEWLGQWWLRAAGGFTARANAVRPVGPPGVVLDDALRSVVEWYGMRTLPAQIQVIVGSQLDAELARRGWSAAPEVCVQTVPLRQALLRLPHGDTGPLVTVSATPSAGWLGAFRGGANGPAAAAVLTNAPRLGFAEVEQVGGAAAAIGRAAVEDAWVGIAAVEVAESRRREGLARSVMASLLHWAADAGARQVYLEVLATNEPALALYEQLGFTTHHRYQCRRAPTS